MQSPDRETIKREAYSKALKLKSTGLEKEAIYARLEKLGFPEDIAMEVAENVLMKKLEEKEQGPPAALSLYSVWQKLFRELFK